MTANPGRTIDFREVCHRYDISSATVDRYITEGLILARKGNKKSLDYDLSQPFPAIN